MKRLILLLLTTGILSMETHPQKLTHEERRIVHNIEKEMPQTLQLLEEIVNINSGTLNVEGVKKVGVLLGKEFANIGFDTAWVTLPDSLKRAGHLVA